MRQSAALQDKGVAFMRRNAMPGWEVAQGKADALRGAAASMDAAAAADSEEASRLAARGEDAAAALAAATAAAVAANGGRDLESLSKRDNSMEGGAACSTLTGASLDAHIMSQQLMEASQAETHRSFALAEQATMLQARANVRRTQAHVLRKQAEEQRRGLHFMQSHAMSGWEGAQARCEGYAKAAAEMEAQAAADEAASLSTAEEARAAADSAEAGGVEAHLQARMEKVANTDYSRAAIATVSNMDLENQALQEVGDHGLEVAGGDRSEGVQVSLSASLTRRAQVWRVLRLDGACGSEQAICSAAYERMMTAIAKQSYDNQLELISTADAEACSRMASTARHIADVAGLRLEADQQVRGLECHPGVCTPGGATSAPCGRPARVRGVGCADACALCRLWAPNS